jgi:hypothetical protein
MEKIEIHIKNLVNYKDYIQMQISSSLLNGLEKENHLKIFIYINKVLNKCGNLRNDNLSKYIKITEEIYNEVYISLRKLNQSLVLYSSSRIFEKEDKYKELKQSINRLELYMKSLYEDLKDFSSKENSLYDMDEQKIFIYFSNFKDCPNSIENLFFNLIQFKDEVYYTKTSDIFEFFYFFRSKDGIWFWSPPKKTDEKDIWIRCPETNIKEGYWSGKLIPEYIKSLIEWLDIFRPYSPGSYFTTQQVEEKVYSQDDEGKKEKFFDDLSKVNKNCLIF